MKNIQAELFHVRLNHREKHHYELYKFMPPTTDHDNETVENFYVELETISCRHHILMGDFNAIFGVRSINDNIKCVRTFGIGNRNDRGERLLDFAEENNLAITISIFQKAENIYWTWKALGGVTKTKLTSKCLQIERS